MTDTATKTTAVPEALWNLLNDMYEYNDADTGEHAELLLASGQRIVGSIMHLSPDTVAIAEVHKRTQQGRINERNRQVLVYDMDMALRLDHIVGARLTYVKTKEA